MTDDHTSVFTVVDVETTGLDPQQHRVIQVAALKMGLDGGILDSFQSIVKPECPDAYDHGAEHIHGISQDSVAQGMPLREVMRRLGDTLTNSVLVAHNAKFDIGFLRAEAERVGYSLPINRHLDTLQLSRTLDTERQHSHRLADLCERFDIPVTKAHDAASDVDATAKLLLRLLDQMGVTSPDQVASLLAE